MKKLFYLVLAIGLSFSASAQVASTFALKAGDTLTNTDTVAKIMKVTAGYAGVVIQPIVTRLSGTAAGSVVLFESLDGINYTPAGDTLTLSNVVSQTKVFRKSAPLPVYYKIEAKSSGTVTEVLTVKYVLRKYQNN